MGKDTIAPTAKAPPGSSVHLLLTCLCDSFFPNAAIATVECLEHLGYSVLFEEQQTCCSQPAFNSGDWNAARKVARHLIKVFSDAEVIVCPSSSCTAMIRWGFPQLFRGESDLSHAEELARKTYEFHEFLVCQANALPWQGCYQKKVALHQACHLRELQSGNNALQLIQSINGLKLVEFENAEQCCGFGGTFSVSFPWTSGQIGKAKLESFNKVNPDEIVSTDNGCILHLGGLKKRLEKEQGTASMPPIRHSAELLRDALRQSKVEDRKSKV